MKKRGIDFVVKNHLCLGCGACAQISDDKSIAIEMDDAGFLRPTGKVNEVDTTLFDQICPGLSVKHESKSEYWTDLWGPVISSYVGWASDENIRHAASSGGGITATICALFELNVIDAALHIEVSKHDPLLNIYSISTNADEAQRKSGSRYAPAAPLTGFIDISKRYSRILIVGKPCDIVAARNLVKYSSFAKGNTYYFISFMCAGVPSLEGTEQILTALGTEKEEISSFRYRGNGWPGFATATLKNGEKRQMTYKESWGGILNKNLQLRCKVCIDGTGEFADLTFADAWHGGEAGYPSFEEEKGRSLILVRTAIGKEIISTAIRSRRLVCSDTTLGMIELMQPYQAIRKKLMLSRVFAMKCAGLQTPVYDLRSMYKTAFSAGIIKNLSSYFGMLRRAIQIRKRN